MPHLWDPNSPTPQAALQRLEEGNDRFRGNATKSSPTKWSEELARVAQRPFAIILACSDARIPVEIVFDQGYGDLFVVRVAGNIVAPSIVGSIEFAASNFGTRLVVVMGHTGCGAISATFAAISTGRTADSKNLRAITDRITPHVEAIARHGQDPGTLREGMRANVRNSVDHLRHGSQILEELVLKGRVQVHGAEY